jgi:hypothetical protein
MHTKVSAERPTSITNAEDVDSTSTKNYVYKATRNHI